MHHSLEAPPVLHCMKLMKHAGHNLKPRACELFPYPWGINRRKGEREAATMAAELVPYAAALVPALTYPDFAAEALGLAKHSEGEWETLLGLLGATDSRIPRNVWQAVIAAGLGIIGTDIFTERGEHWIAKMLSSPETAAALMSASSGGMVNYGGALEHLTDASAPDPNKLTKDQYQAIHEQSMGEKAPPDAVASYLASTSGD